MLVSSLFVTAINISQSFAPASCKTEGKLGIPRIVFTSRLSDYSEPKIEVLSAETLSPKYTIVKSVLLSTKKKKSSQNSKKFLRNLNIYVAYSLFQIIFMLFPDHTISHNLQDAKWNIAIFTYLGLLFQHNFSSTFHVFSGMPPWSSFFTDF